MQARILEMTRHLRQCFWKKFLPQYFNREVNLVKVESQNDKETLELELRNIDQFLENGFLANEE